MTPKEKVAAHPVIALMEKYSEAVDESEI